MSVRAIATSPAATPFHGAKGRVCPLFRAAALCHDGSRINCRELAWRKGRAGSFGNAVARVDIAILDSNEYPVPPGVAGEMTVRSACNLAGYWNDQDATEKAITDGWFLPAISSPKTPEATSISTAAKRKSSFAAARTSHPKR